MTIEKMAALANIAALLPGAYCAYGTYVLLHPPEMVKAIGTAVAAAPVPPDASRLLLAFALAGGLFVLAAILNSIAAFSKGNVPLHVPTVQRLDSVQSFDAQEYIALKKAIYDRYIVLTQEAKALLSLLRIRRVLSASDVAEHFQKYHLTNADKAISDLRNDSVPFLASGLGQIMLNPTLEKLVTETVKADEAEFLKAIDKMTGDAMGYRIKNEPGFAGRYNALSKQQQ